MDDAKNQYVLGYMAKPHREFSYEAEGTVQVQQYNRKPENHEMLYRISSPYTEVGQNLGEATEATAILPRLCWPSAIWTASRRDM